jgi:hypothetical protein
MDNPVFFCPVEEHHPAAKMRSHVYTLADKEAILKEIANGLITPPAAQRKYKIVSRSFVRDWKKSVQMAQARSKFDGWKDLQR